MTILLFFRLYSVWGTGSPEQTMPKGAEWVSWLGQEQSDVNELYRPLLEQIYLRSTGVLDVRAITTTALRCISQVKTIDNVPSLGERPRISARPSGCCMSLL